MCVCVCVYQWYPYTSFSLYLNKYFFKILPKYNKLISYNS